MEETLRRLIDVYRRELELYREIRVRVARQRELIESGCAYSEINTELASKRELLMEIEALEQGIGADRELWRRHRRHLDGRSAKVLMELLAAVTGAVEEIISEERENEILLTSRRRHGLRPVTNAKRAAASYRSHSLRSEAKR